MVALSAAPIAQDDSYSVNENQTLDEAFLGNHLRLTTTYANSLALALVSYPQHGGLTLDRDGGFIYTPSRNYYGTDSFQYKLNDGIADSNVATVTIAITHVSQPPTGLSQTLNMPPDAPYTFGLASFGFGDPNDNPPDQFTGVQVTTLPTWGSLTLSGAPVAAGQLVTVADIAAGNLVFSLPADAAQTTRPSFTFQVADSGSTANGGVDLDPAPKTLTFNAPPVAVDDAYSVNENGVLCQRSAGGEMVVGSWQTLSVGLNQQGGGKLYFYSTNADGRGSRGVSFTPPSSDSRFAPGVYEAVTYWGDNTKARLEYTSGGLWNVYSGHFTVNEASYDASGNLERFDATFLDWRVTWNANVSGVVTVLQNDHDADGDPLTASSLVASPQHGTFSFQSDGGFAYIPDPYFYGTDTFQYLVTDSTSLPYGGGGGAFGPGSVATVTITVHRASQPPSGTSGTVTVPAGPSYALKPADFGFSDPRDTPADTFTTVEITTLPSGSTLTLSGVPVVAGQFVSVADVAAGNLLLTPAIGNPHVSFTFQVQDSGTTDYGGVNVDPDPKTLTFNCLPVAQDASYTVLENQTLDEAFLGNHLRLTTAANWLWPPVYTVDVDSNIVPCNASGNSSSVSFAYPTATPYSWPHAGYTIAFAAAGNAPLVPGTYNGGQVVVYGFPGPYSESFGGQFTVLEAAYGPSGDVERFDVTFQQQTRSGPLTGHLQYNATAKLGTGLLPYVADADGDPLTAVLVTRPQGGTVTLDTDGGFYYAPNLNFNGPDSFQYKANDGIADSNPATVTINVVHVSQAPTGLSNTVTLPSAGPYTIQVADFGFNDFNDSPPDPFIGVQIDTLPAWGRLALSRAPVKAGQFITAADLAAGKLVFTPPGGAQTSRAAFTFQVKDNGSTANGGVVLDPLPKTLTFNRAPVVLNHTYSIAENVVLTVPAATGVLQGAADRDGDQLTVATQSGGVGLRGDGSFVYTPSPYFSGTITFQYKAADGSAESNVATVTIHVLSVRQAPSGTSNVVTIRSGTPYAFQVADFGFSDAYDTPSDNFSRVQIATLPDHGSLRLRGLPVTAGQFVRVADITAKRFTFVPPARPEGGEHAAFTFQVEDGGSTADGGMNLDPLAKTFSINIGPVVGDHSYQTSERVLYGNVFSNALHAKGSSLSAILVSDPQHGRVSLSADGRFTYTPDDSFYGDDSFQYKASDGTSHSNVATVKMDFYCDPFVVRVAGPPSSAPGEWVQAGTGGEWDIIVPGNYFFEAADFTPIHFAPLAVFTHPADAGDFHYQIDWGDGTVDSGVVTNIIPGSYGVPLRGSIDGDHTYSFTAPYYGFATQYNVLITITDPQGQFSTGTLPVRVAYEDWPPRHSPLGMSKVLAISPGVPYVLRAGDFGFSDPMDNPPDNFMAVTITTLPTAGSLQLAGAPVSSGQFVSVADINAGKLTFTPAPLSSPATEAFTFQVEDDGITTLGENLDPIARTLSFYLPPVAQDDAYVVNENTALDESLATTHLSIVSQAGDSIGGGKNYEFDETNATFSASASAPVQSNTPMNGLTIFVEPLDHSLGWTLFFAGPPNWQDYRDALYPHLYTLDPGGYWYAPLLAVSGDGQVVFPDWRNGPSGQFTVNDVQYGPGSEVPQFDATFEQHVSGDPALAGRVQFHVPRPGAVGVLANDAHSDGDPLSAILVAGPQHGTLTLNSDGGFLYTPAAGFHGLDSFQYKATDGAADGNIATVTIDVKPTASFDFNDSRNLTAPGYVGVRAADLYTGQRGYGWLTKPTESTLLGVSDPLLRDGVYGKDNTFRLNVDPGPSQRVTLYLGDTIRSRTIEVFANGSLMGTYTTPIGPPQGYSFTLRSLYSDVLDIELKAVGGPGSYYTISGLDVRSSAGAAIDSLSLFGPSRAVARGTASAFSGTATPGALVTLTTTAGTLVAADGGPLVDASSLYAGVQVQADPMTGAFWFGVCSTAGVPEGAAALATVKAEETTGFGSKTMTLQFWFPPLQEFDFNDSRGFTAPGYVGVRAAELYTAEKGYGWLTSPTEFTLPTVRDPLLKDGVYGVDNTFRLSVNHWYQQRVTVYLGDSIKSRTVQVFANGALMATYTTPVGAPQGYSFTVPSTSGDDWLLDLELKAVGGPGSYFALSGLDVRACVSPYQDWLSLSGPSSAVAGGTVGVFTGTTTDGALVTVTTTNGTLTAADGSPLVDASSLYAGVQMQADRDTGAFSFGVRSPLGVAATATVGAEEVTGIGSQTRTLTFTAPPVQKFDFNDSRNLTAPGYVGVRAADLYTGQKGYGWLTKPTELTLLGVSDPLLRDGVYGKDNTFRLNVDPGSSQCVTLYLGDTVRSRTIQVFANGSLMGTYTTALGPAHGYSFTVPPASGGLLDIELKTAGGAGTYYSIVGLDVAEFAPVSASMVMAEALTLSPRVAADGDGVGREGCNAGCARSQSRTDFNPFGTK